MKTLLNKLKVEHLEQLEANKEKFPLTIDSIKNILSTKSFWSDLTISEAVTLIMNTTNKSISITNLDELFTNE